MSESYWESEIFSVPPLAGLERTSESEVFDWLGLHLPVAAGRIDWCRVSGRRQHRRFDDERLLSVNATREICARLGPDSSVEHVGDGLSPYGVRFGELDAASVVAALLEVPEHHYFVAADRAWIVVVSFEGDLDVVEPSRYRGLGVQSQHAW